MTDSPDLNDKAEQTLNRALQGIPWRRAPADLEARVFQQLENRRGRDRWQRGFTHWPMAARAGFVAIGVSLVTATLVDSPWSSWMYQAIGLVSSTADVLTHITSALPERWIFTFAAAAGALYAILFGLGAVAYRTLYLSPPPPQVMP